eukprot:gene479-895_t
MTYSGPELYVDMIDGTFSLEESNADDHAIIPGLQSELLSNLHDTANDFPEATALSSWEMKIYYRVNELLCWLVPSSSAIARREVVIEYVKSIISRCLGARMFSVGAMMSKTFLPDEIIQITPFLCKGQDENWFIRVNEALCASSTGANKIQGISVDKITFFPNEVKIVVELNNLAVDISPNELASLYSSALFEDFNTLVGHENLFKKSVILVKAWLTYEAPRFVTEFFADPSFPKNNASTLLPQSALNALMIWLFYSRGSSKTKPNESSIEHPMEALGIFLTIFSAIEWDTVAIAACAMLRADDFSSLTGDMPTSPFTQRIEMLVESYRQRYVSTVRASQKCRDEIEDIDNNPDMDSLMRDVDGVLLDSDLSFSPHFGQQQQSQSPYHSSSSSQAMGMTIGATPVWAPLQTMDQPTFCEPTPNYQRSPINILDPVQPLVNLCAKSDKRTMQMLETALRRGYESFLVVQRAINDNNNNNNNHGTTGKDEEEDDELVVLRTFFHNTFAILTNPSRTEDTLTQGLTTTQVSQNLESVTTEEVEYCMRHAELVLASKITADAVAYLIIHVIEQRGPQPIGEIGKLLQEATGNPNLSKVLKSQFRGLKRLIEGYPHLLRLGDDHSFNPHVHLVSRQSLGARAMAQQDNNQMGGRLPLGFTPAAVQQHQHSQTGSGRTSPITMRIIPQGQPMGRPNDNRSPARNMGVGVSMSSMGLEDPGGPYGQYSPVSGFQQHSNVNRQQQRTASPPAMASDYYAARNQYQTAEYSRQQQQSQQQQQQQSQQQGGYGRSGKNQLWTGGNGNFPLEQQQQQQQQGGGRTVPANYQQDQPRWDMMPAERRGFGFAGVGFNQSSPHMSPNYSPNVSPSNSRSHSPSGVGRMQSANQGGNNYSMSRGSSSPIRRSGQGQGQGQVIPSNKPTSIGGGSGPYSTSPVFSSGLGRLDQRSMSGGGGGGFYQQQQEAGFNINASASSSSPSRGGGVQNMSPPMIARTTSPDIMGRNSLPPAQVGLRAGASPARNRTASPSAYQPFGMNAIGSDSERLLGGLQQYNVMSSEYGDQFGMLQDLHDDDQRQILVPGVTNLQSPSPSGSSAAPGSGFNQSIDIDFSVYNMK